MGRLLKNRIFDVMHKTTVGSLMALTAVSVSWLMYKGIIWVTVERPRRVEEYRRKKEQRMLEEQKTHEAELLKENDRELLKA